MGFKTSIKSLFMTFCCEKISELLKRFRFEIFHLKLSFPSFSHFHRSLKTFLLSSQALSFFDFRGSKNILGNSTPSHLPRLSYHTSKFNLKVHALGTFKYFFQDLHFLNPSKSSKTWLLKTTCLFSPSFIFSIVKDSKQSQMEL